MAANDEQALYLPARPFALVIDRWIWVFMAVFFIAITLAGFVPDSIAMVGMVRAGAMPPFPPILHVHAVLMGAFLLLLLAQSWLMATGRRDRHMRLGRLALGLLPAIIVVGFILVPTIYQQVWNGARAAPPPIQARLRQTLHFLDNLALVQFRIGILFPVCIGLALHALRRDPGFHKRMMFLATAIPLQAAIGRLAWLPSTVPASPLSLDLYVLLAVSPMLLWDVIGHRTVPRVYPIWLALFLLSTIPMYLLWDTPAWHALAQRILAP
ncbi:MAG: hypothetical protein RSP_20110 [Rhodanobacter sp.]